MAICLKYCCLMLLYDNMKSGSPIYVAHADGGDLGYAFRTSFAKAGFKLQSCLVWKKSQFTLSRTDYQQLTEPLLYGWKPGSAHRWYGGRKQHTVVDLGHPAIRQHEDGRWSIEVGDQVLIVDGAAKLEESQSNVIFFEKPKRSPIHPTTKPVGLVEKMLKNSARPGDIVIDSFGGSGTTLIAADRLGMCARLSELDPRFVDAICVRYANYTGRVPVHAETGAEFPGDVIDKLTASWEK